MVDVLQNWLNWFHFLFLKVGLLVIQIDCMIFLSPFPDVTKMSMSVSFLAHIDTGRKKIIYTTSAFNFVKDIKRCRANLSASNLLHALKFSQIKNNPFNFLLKFNNSHFLRSKTMILLLKFGNLGFFTHQGSVLF